MSDMNIYQRINAVMKEVEYVQKDATVSGGGSYKAVSHDQVISVIRKAMVTHGIVVRLEQLKGDIVQMRDLKADIKMHLYSADYAVHFINIDKPELEGCIVTINAHAADTGDKAPGKAASYAVKYAMLKTFSLETGESDESRGESTQGFTKPQQAEFDELVQSRNALGFVCFSQFVGEPVMQALVNSFPKGSISSGKKIIRDLETEGWKILKQSAAEIQEAISKNESSTVLELVSELEPAEKRLVAGMLNDSDINTIKKLQDLAA